MVTSSEINLDVEDISLGVYFRIVNIYGPYVDKIPFWGL
jgi:hypothetical protein